MKPLKISHLSVGFVALVAVMALALAVYMTHELNDIGESVQARERQAAAEEIREALLAMDQEAQRIASSLAEWDETRQQLAFDEYYELWRDHRVKSSGRLPATVHTVALYGKAGNILRPNLVDDPLPSRLPHDRLPIYLFMSGAAPDHGHQHLAYFRPVHADPSGKVLMGYVGIKFDLLDELVRTRKFRFADITSIHAPGKSTILASLDKLAQSIVFQVRSNPSLELIQEVFQKELINLLIFVIVILSIASYLLHRVMIRPLLAISREIDTLRGTSDRRGGKLMPEVRMPVVELENVRRSFNNYQNRLAELHSNLEQTSLDFYEQARHDALTGVYNRRAFEEDWHDVCDESDRCALLLFDCDYFKTINDTYGHAVGDEVIKGIGYCLEKALRSGDRLYRLGGDEFATVLPDADDEVAQAIAERCQEHVQNHDFRQIGLAEPVSFSIGIALADHRVERLGLSEMQKRADLAMYAAKRPASRKIVFYHCGLDEVAALVANKLVSNVYQAIQEPNLIELHYQAIVRLPEMETEYVEALARIRIGDGLIFPGDIFPIVQARRLDAEFDLAVLRAVELDMSNGRLVAGQGVSINISAAGIVHSKVVDALFALRRSEQGRKIVIEITETALITQMAVASSHIQQLREAGFVVALDDFGSGYSSLRYLTTMPVDLVKFDISMIRLLEHENRREYFITGGIAALVKASGYKIVAEGIETREILEKAKNIGFDYAQGYLFDRPS